MALTYYLDQKGQAVSLGESLAAHHPATAEICSEPPAQEDLARMGVHIPKATGGGVFSLFSLITNMDASGWLWGLSSDPWQSAESTFSVTADFPPLGDLAWPVSKKKTRDQTTECGQRPWSATQVQTERSG